MLSSYLLDRLIDGWIYWLDPDDGVMRPYLVTEINMIPETRKAPARVDVRGCYFGSRRSGHGHGYDHYGNDNDTIGEFSRDFVFSGSEVARRKLSAILVGKGLYPETTELRKAYDEGIERHRELVADGFSEQFRYAAHDGYASKVIHDLTRDDVRSHPGLQFNFDQNRELETPASEIPIHPDVRVFDLRTHNTLWVHSSLLTPYQYDATLKDRLVLPRSHHDLLDILTTDISVLSEDFIEGKAAGNIILCKGDPGVGKTLTAEVYAEVMKRPLYSIRSGSLGSSADEISLKLEHVFKRCRRWNCVLLLDEADVFVLERGDDPEQNAIVAEFLRALEYFPGIMFMTTNRGDRIEAVRPAE
jgi:hypothetical protein